MLTIRVVAFFIVILWKCWKDRGTDKKDKTAEWQIQYGQICINHKIWLNDSVIWDLDVGVMLNIHDGCVSKL